MRFTYNWLKDFVDIKISPHALAAKLTMAGIEIASLEKAGSDFVFEAEITSNRPDWLSVAGIAREVAALTGKKIRIPPLAAERKTNKRKGSGFSIRIEDKKDCPLYTARVISDVRVGPSPDWLTKRLEAIGCRSVNNVVDITNYVMFTLGQPLHAFDLDKLHTDRIGVRRAHPGETLISIDGGELRLDRDALVITAKGKPVAVAGVMGGRDTEVTSATKNILLEAAIFNPVVVRRGRRKLGMQSESSYRFERGVDPGSVEFASRLAAQMITELAGGACVLDKASGSLRPKQNTVSLSTDRARNILNLGSLNPIRIKQILQGLGFSAKITKKNIFAVKAPTFRQDVRLEADLIEEIARIAGYDNIPTTLPSIIPQFSHDPKRELVSRAKEILAGLGLNEVITYSLVPREWLTYANTGQLPSIEVANPLSREQEVLRPTLIASLLRCIAYNLNQQRDHAAIFEIADVFFSRESGEAGEELKLGIALCGERQLWSGQGRVRDDANILEVKGIAEVLFQRLGLEKNACKFIPREDRIAVSVQDNEVGYLVKPPRNIVEQFDIKNKDVFAAEISLDKLFACMCLQRRFTPFARFPGISRDISLEVKEDIPASRLLEIVTANAAPLLEEAQITDYYKGKQVAWGFKGITVTCRYASSERTLTDAEVNALHASVVAELEKQVQAKIR
jgi:phenylalanyl-tRNA synthetase beta chain